LLLAGSQSLLIDVMLNQRVDVVFVGRHSVEVTGTLGEWPNIWVVAFDIDRFIPVLFNGTNAPDMRICDALLIAGRNRSFHLCDATCFMSMRDVALMTGCSFILNSVRDGVCNFGVMREIEMISSLQTHESLCKLPIPMLSQNSESDLITLTSAIIAFIHYSIETVRKRRARTHDKVDDDGHSHLRMHSDSCAYTLPRTYSTCPPPCEPVVDADS
jgi:hypothetical protein